MVDVCLKFSMIKIAFPCLDVLKTMVQVFHLLLPFLQDVVLLNVLEGEFYYLTKGSFEIRE